MSIDPDATVADLDEALTRLVADLIDARRNNHTCRVQVLWSHIDDVLEARYAAAPPVAPPRVVPA